MEFQGMHREVTQPLITTQPGPVNLSQTRCPDEDRTVKHLITRANPTPKEWDLAETPTGDERDTRLYEDSFCFFSRVGPILK